MKSAKSSYEEERAFQAAHAANEILSNVNDKYSGSSPYSNRFYFMLFSVNFEFAILRT